MPQSPMTLYMWLLLTSLSAPPYPSSSWPPPWFVHFALAFYKTNATGSDRNSSWVSRESRLTGPFIVHTLAYLYKLALQLSIVTTVQWKNSTVIPVPKVAVPVKPADYHPISLLPIFSTKMVKLLISGTSRLYPLIMSCPCQSFLWVSFL